MNTTEQEQGEEARKHEETPTKIVPMDETSVNEPEQDQPADVKRSLSLADLGVEVAPVDPSKTSNVIRASWSMGLTLSKKKAATSQIRMGTRVQWMAVIKQHAQTVMSYHGRAALTAREVLAALKAHDLMVYEMEDPVGMGDALGVRGLRLPVVLGAGAKHYYLPAATMTAEERAAFDTLSTLEKVRLILDANAALQSHGG